MKSHARKTHPSQARIAQIELHAARPDLSGLNFVVSGPEQNRTETVQNRTGRRSKTGFLRVEIEVDGIERVKNDT
jgi:hypothetical protein